MAKRNIPVDLFYASYNSDCTYELNSRLFIRKKKNDLQSEIEYIFLIVTLITAFMQFCYTFDIS